MSAPLHGLPERLERPVQVHPHRRLRALEHGRDLRGRELLLHREEHGRPLARREPVDGCPERAHRLLASELVGRVMRGCGLPLEEPTALRLVLVPGPEPPPAIPPAMVQAEVEDDPVEPRRESSAPAEAPGGLVEPDERLLRDVARVLRMAQDGPREAPRTLAIPLDQEGERPLPPPPP